MIVQCSWFCGFVKGSMYPILENAGATTVNDIGFARRIPQKFGTARANVAASRPLGDSPLSRPASRKL